MVDRRVNDADFRELRATVALACRVLAFKGLAKETTCHVSARIPGTNQMLIRAGSALENALLITEPEDVIRVDFDGKGPGASDAASGIPQEHPIHGEIYKSRPDVIAVVHAHPPMSLLCGMADLPLRPIFGAYDPTALGIALNGVPMFERSVHIHTAELGRQMLQAMGDTSVCLLRGHGITVTGRSVEEATVRAIKLETLAEKTVELARLRPDARPLSDEDQAFFRPLVERFRESPDSSLAIWRSYLVQSLDATNGDLATKVRRLMFVFDDLVHLDDRGLQRVLREVDGKDLAHAMRPASEDLKEKIYRNQSIRAAQALRGEMEIGGPVRLRQVEEAQQRIVNIVRRLDDAEEIVIQRGGDDVLI